MDKNTAHNLLALIIEDEPDVGNVFFLAMKQAGFQTEVIDSGDAALAWLAARVPDVIILDIRLPYVSGEEILRQIRADPRLAKTPVIVATAYPDAIVSLQGRADRVLIKPVRIDQLGELAIRLCTSSE